VEATITKQGLRNLNSLGPQRKRPPRDDKPRQQAEAETPPSAPAAAPEEAAAATPVPAADQT
jgi:hypothetical protein